MLSPDNVYRFRIQIEDVCLFGASSILSIFVQYGHRLCYADLLDRIIRSHPKVYSERVPDNSYYLLINNQPVYDDSRLHTFLSCYHSSMSPSEVIQVKLMKKSTAPLITTSTKNVALPQPYIHSSSNRCDLPPVSGAPYNSNLRRDSGISFFEQDLMKFTINKRCDSSNSSNSSNSSRRASTAYASPATTPTPTYNNSPVLSFFNTDGRKHTTVAENKNVKVRLPGVTSLLLNSENHCCYSPRAPATPASIITPPTPPMPPMPPMPYATSHMLRRSSCCPEFSTNDSASPYHHQQFMNRRHSAVPLVHHNKMTPSTKRHLNQRQQHTFICDHIVDSKTGRRCSQSFRRSYDLSRHQTIHLKNRPFCVCHFCGKKFTRLDALRRHERIQGHILHC